HQTENRVTALVISDALLVGAAQEERARGAELDLLERVEKVLLPDVALPAARGQQRRFVDEVLQIRAGEPRRDRGEAFQGYVRRERYVPCVHLENFCAPRPVREIHDDTPVEPSGAQECSIEYVRLVRRGQDDDALTAREAVHLGQDLVQGLLLLGGSAEDDLASRATDGVQLVDEDDRRRVVAGFLEEVPYSRRADPDDHLHELGAAHRKERHTGLSGDRSREQRLAGARRADQEHALRRRPTESRVLRRILQEVDDLDQLRLGFVDAGDVVERDLRIRFLVVAARLALAEAHERAAEATALLRAPEHPHVEPD